MAGHGDPEPGVRPPAAGRVCNTPRNTTRRFNKWRNAFAVGIAALITIGNVSFPIAVLTGVVG